MLIKVLYYPMTIKEDDDKEDDDKEDDDKEDDDKEDEKLVRIQ